MRSRVLHRQRPKAAAKPKGTYEPRSEITLLSPAFITGSRPGQGMVGAQEREGILTELFSAVGPLTVLLAPVT